MIYQDIQAIDLFCGVGGLTKGLEKAGIHVLAGLDSDPACSYPFEENNDAVFIHEKIEDVSALDLKNLWKDGKYRLLAGCAPCQPFSRYSHGANRKCDERWSLLDHFSRLVIDVLPDFVTMENVPGLERHGIFHEFLNSLYAADYAVTYKTVNCIDYGVAQNRQRLVLLASRLGPVDLIPPTHKPNCYRTVRDEIFVLPRLEAGAVDKKDPMHRASSLSEKNMERISASKPGGTWRDWDADLITDCHKKDSGKTYPSVYGRMKWDRPSPTITTQFYGFGNGRFGHPEQNRALSLREGAILQSFPRWYKFVPSGRPVYYKTIGRLIGNAVPVKLGKAIGRSFVRHLKTIDERSFEDIRDDTRI